MSKFDSKKWQAALALLKQRRQHFADWEESCAMERRQGYAPSACVHGTSRWTDYDNICGPCEDGLGYWDYAVQARACLDEVARIEVMVSERQQIIRSINLIDERYGSRRVPKFNDFGMLLDWAYSPWDLVA